MATGNEKRLPVLQAIVSTSVKARFASCGEREANVVFISPGPILHSLEGSLHGLAWYFSPFFFFLPLPCSWVTVLWNIWNFWACMLSVFCVFLVLLPGFLWAHSSETHFSLPYNITSSLLITLLLFFSHSQIDPKVAFPRRAQPKVRINWSLTLLKENDYVSRQQLT